MKNLKIILTIFLLLIFYAYFASIAQIPKQITLLAGENFKIKTLLGTKIIETVKTSNESTSKVEANINLFGKLNVKTVNVNILEDIKVVPVGKIIGLKLYTNGVLIVGMSGIENLEKNIEKPFENLDIKEGDTIIKVNGKELDSTDTLKKFVKDSNGSSLNLTLVRDGEVLVSNITPIKTGKDEYKLGLWVRDAATGVGTITYYEPKSRMLCSFRTWNN